MRSQLLPAMTDSNRRIKLLHVVNRFGVGGSERQQTELIKRLPSERYQQVVATMEDHGRFREDIKGLGVEIGEFPTVTFYDRNALHQYRSLARLIKQQGIQLVHCHDFYSNFLGSVASKLAGQKKLITSRRNMGIMFSTVQRLGQRMAYAFSAAVISNSDTATEILVKKEFVPRRKIHRIYNGIDTDHFSPAEPPAELAQLLGLSTGAPIIGTVGRLYPGKGQDTFIRAAVEVHKIRPDVQFLIVGGGPAEEEFRQLAQQLGAASAIVFAGERRDIADLLALMDVFVLSSLAESLPNAVLEAMACALPVVATNVGGVPEIVTEAETGFLVEPKDHHALADRILKILGNPDLAAGMGAVARKKVLEEFSCDKLVENVESVYAAVLGCNETVPAPEQLFAGED